MGGVIEDVSWKACPPGYYYNPDLDLANGPGFEHSMNTLEFLPGGLHQPGPASSTPAISSLLITPGQGNNLPTNLGSVRRQNGAERFPGMVNINVDTDLPPPLPSRVEPGVVGAHQHIPEDVQYQINNHRAANQVENIRNDRPSGDINITHLRRDNYLATGVEDYMQSVIRQRIPSLSSAQTAQTSEIVLLGGDQQRPVTRQGQGAYSYNSEQLQQATGDGIRVTGANYQSPQYNQNPPNTVRSISPQHVPVIRSCVVQPGVVQQSQQHHHVPAHPSTVARQHADQRGQHYDDQGQEQFVNQGRQQYSDQRQHQYSNQIDQQYIPSSAFRQQYSPVSGLYRQTGEASQSPQQPVLARHAQGAPLDTRYCYERMVDVTGNTILVRTPLPQSPQLVLPQAPHMMAVQQPVVAQSTTYPQQQQQFVSRQQPDSAGYRTEVRYSPTTGRQIQIKVPVNNLPAHTGPAQYRNELRYNTHTGVPYHVHVPLQGSSPNQQPQYGQPLHQQPALQGRLPQHSQPQEQYLPNQDVSHHVQQSFSHLCDQQQDQDRVAGIVSLLEGGVTKKQPKILEHAKKCPTKWSKQATMNNIN